MYSPLTSVPLNTAVGGFFHEIAAALHSPGDGGCSSGKADLGEIAEIAGFLSGTQ